MATTQSSNDRRRLRVFGSALTAMGLVAVAVLAWPNRPSVTLLASNSQTQSGAGSCDVTGVHVSYGTAWSQSSSQRAIVVPTATVSGITQPSCSGATLTVTLTLSDPVTHQQLGTAAASAVVSSSTSQPVQFATPLPRAAQVTAIQVSLSGGTTPVPPECAGMTFSFTNVGTTGNDTLTGTNGNDLIYSLGGTDKINGLEGNDCLNGGSGTTDNDTMTDGNGNDVILAGDGADSVTVGSGQDVIRLGNGNDSVQTGNPGGSGDTVELGTGIDSVTIGNGPATIYSGGRTRNAAGPSSPAPGATTAHVGSGVLHYFGGAGNDTIYLSTGGSGTVDGGNGTNICHVPSKKYSYSIINCTVVSP